MPVLKEQVWVASTYEAEDFVYLDIDDDTLTRLELDISGDVPVITAEELPIDYKRTFRTSTSMTSNSSDSTDNCNYMCDQQHHEGSDTPPRDSSVSESPPNGGDSICHLRAAELFPKRGMHSDDPSLSVPFLPICGEAVQYLGRTQDGILALSNYRVYHCIAKGVATIIPLKLVESVDVRDIFYLHIMCKDARSLRCTFNTGEQCIEWQRRLEGLIQPPSSLEGLFSFPFRAWAAEPDGIEVMQKLSSPLPLDPHADFRKEVTRLQFDLHGAWRISSANSEFKLCPSYPPLLLVPACVSDDALEIVAKFRSSRRIPAVVWRHRGNGAVIARCSQPEVGWLGWRSNEDEQLLGALAAACQFDRGPVTMGANGTRELARKVLIVDARSYASAVTNRARGGGCECPQYYPCAEIQFMCLPNIHSVRKSFQALRTLVAEPSDHANWHSVLEKSLWLQAVGGLLRAASLVAHAVHDAARPTLVHCSDGWDRTPQIVATAQLLLDPYYRTLEGFRVLVEREWLDFGHKFADRCGHTVGSEDLNERCPVFLQWLDCVHQILVQYPCSFEFSQSYLVKLAQHAYSCLFGTFLCNSKKERTTHRVSERTFSVWRFLKGSEYKNHLYEPNGDEVLYPVHSARALVVWAAVYLGAAPDTPAPLQQPLVSQPTTSTQSPSVNGNPSNGVLTKTRSFGDLLSLSETGNNTYRRSSDPNIAVDSIKLNSMTISPANGNAVYQNNTDSQKTSDELSDDSVGSDISNDNKYKPEDQISNSYIQMKNLINSTSSDGLINTTIPKQVVNGYSKSNGNIVPILNGGMNGSIDISKMIESNIVSKSDESSMKNGSCIYENGNSIGITVEQSLIDSPDQIDGVLDNMEYGEQAVEIPEFEERPAKIINAVIPNKPLINTPPEDGVVFLEGNFSEASDGSGRARNESLTLRSVSECSSSSGCVDLGAELNTYGTEPTLPTRNNSMRRQRLDSVQNGGLNDSAAILLETEIGNLISAESAAMRLSEQRSLSNNTNNHGHRRQKSDGSHNTSSNFEYFPPPVPCSTVDDLLSCSDMTLCPNSPLRAFHRTHSAGAGNGLSKWHGCPVPAPCNSDATTTDLVKTYDSSDNCKLCLPNNDRSMSWVHHARKYDCPHSKPNNKSNITGVLDPVDGLVYPQSPIQHRLYQIIQDHKMREEQLMRELHAARAELLQRAYRTARLTPDHTEVKDFETAQECTDAMMLSDNSDEAYLGDSSGPWPSNPEYYPSSDSSSMTAETAGYYEGGPTSRTAGSVLWVPDHAVSRCTRCASQFWLGKRKHHCRSCGRIFCAECSENTHPLPNEQLFNPVRVCAECFASLSHSNSTTDDRICINEHSLSGVTQSAGNNRIKQSSASNTTTMSINSAEVRHVREACKQAVSNADQKMTANTSSPVTAASN